jgi:hypothetical protein
MNNRLRVAAILEHMAARLQFRADRLKIVNLAIEDDGNRSIRIIHWLVAARRIDDRQTAVAEGNAGLQMKAFAIGAAIAFVIA